MSENCGLTVRSTEPTPAAWQELINCATANILPYAPYSRQDRAMEAVREYAQGLDVETLEANRYHGLGLVACCFVQTISTGGDQDAFVATAAKSLVNRHPAYCEQEGLDSSCGLYVQELEGSVLYPTPTAEFVRLYDDEIPLAPKLVANGLVLERKRRDAATAKVSARLPYDPLSHPWALTAVARNSMGGASRLTKSALMGMYERLNAGAKPNPAVMEVLDPGQLAVLCLTQSAKASAKLRADEFIHDLGELVKIDATGHVFIDPKAIPKEPGPVRPIAHGYMLDRKSRRRCPVVYIAEAIKIVSSLTPRSVAAAQRLLLAS